MGNPGVALFEPTRPFQLPLGSLLPRHPDNLLAACKNIGTTHLTNGAYRLHPVEWAVGEAAGRLAASCSAQGLKPLEVCRRRPLLRRFQHTLLQAGVPLAWTPDVAPAEPDFVAAQLLVIAGGIAPGSARAHRLELELDAPLLAAGQRTLRDAAAALLGDFGVSGTPQAFAAGATPAAGCVTPRQRSVKLSA